jgi:ribokinase
LLAELDSYGVEHSNNLVPNMNTGVVVVIVGAEGERTMFPDSGANAGLGINDLPDLDAVQRRISLGLFADKSHNPVQVFSK